jgi:glycosyltransferase involved in cell wall biosynthesis
VRSPRIGVLVLAYNAAERLVRTIQRIPSSMMERLEEVFIFDDHSTDDTYVRIREHLGREPMRKVRVFSNERNLRYGGNQKRGYHYAIERGLDFVVLLHGDGQYSPEVMEQLLEPLERGEAEMVMGSRMMPGSHPLHGGMPMYKFVGNKVLTRLENWMLGTRFCEFHSGYRVYSCHALRQVPFTRCSDEWHFDTDVIIQFLAKGFRIVERPIPTYYGDEICHVNGVGYAYHCLESVVSYRLHRLGWRWVPKFDVGS